MNLFRNVQALNQQSSVNVLGQLKDIVGGDIEISTLFSYSLNDWQAFADGLHTQGLTVEDANELMSLLLIKYPDYEAPTSQLLSPISTLSKPLEWPLIDVSVSQSVPLQSVNFAYSGQVSSTLSIEALANAPHETWPLLPTSQSLLNYQLIGKFSAGTALDMSITSGALALSLSGGIQASGAGALNLYFMHEASVPLINAALNDFAYIDDFADFTVMQASNFVGLTVELKGGLKVESSVKLGCIYETQYSLDRQITNKPVAINIGLGAEVSWQLDGEMLLSCYKGDNASELIIEVAKKRSTLTTHALSIGANVVAPGMKLQATRYVKELQAYHQDIMSILDKYAEPKAWLVENINRHLTNTPQWPQKILGVAIGQETSQALQADIAELIADELSIPLGRFSQWSDDLNQQNIISNSLARRIGRSKADDTEAYLFKLLNETAKDYYQDIASEVKAWLTESIDQAVLAPLSAFGLQVNDVLDNSEAGIKQVMEPLLKLIEAYNSHIMVMADFIDNTLVEELGIDFKRSEKSLSTDESLIKVKFQLQASDQAQLNALIGECLTGDFRTVLSTPTDANGLYQLEQSVFKKMQDNTKTFSLSINLFGLKASKQTIFNASSAIQYDGAGQLSVYETESILEAINGSGNEKINVKLLNHVNLLQGSDSRFSITAGYSDGDLTRAELQGFLRIFEGTGLIEQGTTAKIANELSAQQLMDVSEDHTLRIANVLSLTPAEVSVACAVSDEVKFNTAVEQQCLAWNQYALLNPNSGYADQMWLLACYDKTRSVHDNVLALAQMSTFAGRRALKKVFDRLYPRAPSALMKKRTRQAIRRVNSMCDNAASLIEYLNSLQQLMAQAAPTSMDHALSASAIEALTNTSEHLNDVIEEWVKTFYSVFQIDIDRAHPTSVALLGVFNALSGKQSGTIVPLIYRQQGGLAKPIVIL